MQFRIELGFFITIPLEATTNQCLAQQDGDTLVVVMYIYVKFL